MQEPVNPPPHEPPSRRQGDSAAVAHGPLRLYRLDGRIARIGLLIDATRQAAVDLQEQVQRLIPHAECRTVDAPASAQHWFAQGLFAVRAPKRSPLQVDPAWDVVFRIGGPEILAPVAPAETLDVAYLLDSVESEDAAAGLGDLQRSDRVLAASRTLHRLLSRRYAVEAALLYPGFDLPTGDRERAALGPLKVLDGALSETWELALSRLSRQNIEIVRLGADQGVFEPGTAAPFGLLVPPDQPLDRRVLEATAAGVPVIAASGSACAEAVRGFGETAPTGILIERETPDALADAVRLIDRHPHVFAPSAMRDFAARFSAERFRSTLAGTLWAAWTAHLALLAEPEPEPEPPTVPDGAFSDNAQAYVTARS